MAGRKFHRYIARSASVLALTGWIAIFAQDTSRPGNSTGDTSTKNDSSSIQGTVVAAAGGEPLRGARLEISGKIIVASSSKVDLGQLAITLSPAQGLEQFGFAEVKEDRTFTVSNIRPGTYGLQLSGLPEGWYVSAADFGGENVLETGLKLGDAGSHMLVVTVRSGMGKIEGTVLKGDDPVSGASVDLIPEHPSPYRADLARTTATDQRGHFVIPDVVPGKYRALAATREDNESDDDSDDPTAGDSSDTNIEVGEGESKTVQLKLRTGR